jgi:hypothetical protein
MTVRADRRGCTPVPPSYSSCDPATLRPVRSAATQQCAPDPAYRRRRSTCADLPRSACVDSAVTVHRCRPLGNQAVSSPPRCRSVTKQLVQSGGQFVVMAAGATAAEEPIVVSPQLVERRNGSVRPQSQSGRQRGNYRCDSGTRIIDQVFISQHDPMGLRWSQPAEDVGSPTAGPDSTDSQNPCPQLGFVAARVFLARLARPRDQGVTAVSDQADRPVVLVDVGIPLPVGLDEMRIVGCPQLSKACRTVGEPDRSLPRRSATPSTS